MNKNPEKHIECIAIERIITEPQDRITFDLDGLRELADSLDASGQAEPILLRFPLDAELRREERLLLVCGERRLRAAAMLGWSHIEGIVQELDDRQAAALQWAENRARLDLNPIEQARAIRHRMEIEGTTSVRAIGRILGLPAASVSDRLQLLELIEPMQMLIATRQVSPGYGLAMASRHLDAERQHLAIRYLAATPSHKLNLAAFQAYCQRLYLEQYQDPLWKEPTMNMNYTVEAGKEKASAESPYAPHPDLPPVPKGRNVTVVLERFISELEAAPDPTRREAARVLAHTYAGLKAARLLRG